MLPNIKRWSHSALNQYVQCPYRYYTNKVGPKHNKEPFVETQALKDGKIIHKRIQNHVNLGIDLDGALAEYPDALLIVKQTFQMLEKQGFDTENAVAEDSMLLARDLETKLTDPFDKRVFVQADADIVARKRDDPGHAALVDWKTGKFFKRTTQGAVNAMCLFAYYPELHTIDATFTYFKTEDIDTETFKRDGFWEHPSAQILLRELLELNNAMDTGIFPKKRSGLCKYCKVASCEFMGR